jgi:hypothetical protein
MSQKRLSLEERCDVAVKATVKKHTKVRVIMQTTLFT